MKRNSRKKLNKMIKENKSKKPNRMIKAIIRKRPNKTIKKKTKVVKNNLKKNRIKMILLMSFKQSLRLQLFVYLILMFVLCRSLGCMNNKNLQNLNLIVNHFCSRFSVEIQTQIELIFISTHSKIVSKHELSQKLLQLVNKAHNHKCKEG